MRFFLGLVAWLLVPMFLMNAMGLGIQGLPSYLVFFFLPASVCLIIYQVICRKNRSGAEVRIPLGLTWFIISGLMALLSFTLLSQASPGGLIYETDLASRGQYFAEKGLRLRANTIRRCRRLSCWPRWGITDFHDKRTYISRTARRDPSNSVIRQAWRQRASLLKSG